MPSSSSEGGTDGLGTVSSILEKSRTDHRGRPSDGTLTSLTHAGLQMFKGLPTAETFSLGGGLLITKKSSD